MQLSFCGSRLRPKRTALRSKAASKTEYDSRPFIKSNLAGRSFCLEVMPIPCPHFKITIVKRSQGQSAVAGAAYQSGERLFSEYDQKTKFYNKKKELVHAEIMLPSHAPPGFADRATLWNAVEAVENQWNSQLARRIVLAFPVEVPKEQYLSMIKEFCQEQFVAKGMIADFAIHDKGDGNPHAHILLTLRAMDAHGKWLPKARKVYDLDENGERIQLPSGNWRCHKENTVDWNDQKYAEIWRHSWETITNRYLEAAGRPERVDLRSFERQGIQQIPTVHLGPAAHQMEKRGVETFLGNLNRDIQAANSLMRELHRRGKTPDPEHYEVTYYADLPAMWQDVPNNEVLEELFQMFNLSRPQDFEGHSLSVSDVIVLKRNGEVSVHYVDSIGFKDLQGFLDKQPERPSVLMNLKEKCDAPECNPTVCRKARDEHEL